MTAEPRRLSSKAYPRAFNCFQYSSTVINT